MLIRLLHSVISSIIYYKKNKFNMYNEESLNYWSLFKINQKEFNESSYILSKVINSFKKKSSDNALKLLIFIVNIIIFIFLYFFFNYNNGKLAIVENFYINLIIFFLTIILIVNLLLKQSFMSKTREYYIDDCIAKKNNWLYNAYDDPYMSSKIHKRYSSFFHDIRAGNCALKQIWGNLSFSKNVYHFHTGNIEGTLRGSKGESFVYKTFCAIKLEKSCECSFTLIPTSFFNSHIDSYNNEKLDFLSNEILKNHKIIGENFSDLELEKIKNTLNLDVQNYILELFKVYSGIRFAFDNNTLLIMFREDLLIDGTFALIFDMKKFFSPRIDLKEKQILEIISIPIKLSQKLNY